jgi:subtilisin family serine protease
LIAIIDSDIDLSNTALNEKIWFNEGEDPNDNIDNDRNGYVDDVHGWNFYDNNKYLYNEEDAGNHGTFIAGILFGSELSENYAGILTNYDVSYMCLKVLQSKTESGSIASVIEAIKYAEKNGAKICCVSLATYRYSQELKNVMSNSDMLFVVASGNDGNDIDNELSIYPACFNLANIITVADIRCDGNLSLTSNYGEISVDIAAPGTDIISVIPNNKYTYLSGTSFATAMVVGEAALCYCCCPIILSANQIRNIIIQNSTHSPVLEGKVLCSGYINIYDALVACLNY